MKEINVLLFCEKQTSRLTPAPVIRGDSSPDDMHCYLLQTCPVSTTYSSYFQNAIALFPYVSLYSCQALNNCAKVYRDDNRTDSTHQFRHRSICDTTSSFIRYQIQITSQEIVCSFTCQQQQQLPPRMLENYSPRRHQIY